MSIMTLGDCTRPQKPRKTGQNAIIDPGLPLHAFHDLIDCQASMIDAVKFGWATAIVTPFIKDKIRLLRTYGIPFWFGGTLFERAYAEGRMRDFIDFINECRVPCVEISDGTVDIPHALKLRWIRELSDDFLVLSEIGKKASDVEPDARSWCDAIHAELEAGARWVILEGREGGNAGLYDPEGQPRTSLISQILKTTLRHEDLFFEAPKKEHQAFFIREAGPCVNLSNLAPADIIGVETLRRGLRSDTFWTFPPAAEDREDRRAIA